MVRNMIQKALPVIALMSVVVTARYAIAETGHVCYKRLCTGMSKPDCYICCDNNCKNKVNCQESCDGNPLPNYGPDTSGNDVLPGDGGGDPESVS